MKQWIKLLAFASMVLVAYGVAWFKAYNLSADYYAFADQQYRQGNLVQALKGMNKLELRRNETYLGGYQQVIETWENAMLGPKPDFYYAAQTQAETVLPKLSEDELLAFIETYVELDVRYVPAAAERLMQLAENAGNNELYLEMDDFLSEAFPTYHLNQNKTARNTL